MAKESSIAKNILYHRLKRFRSRRALVEKIEEVTGERVSNATVANWEEGRTEPVLSMAVALAGILDVSLYDLTGVEEPCGAEGQEPLDAMRAAALLSENERLRQEAESLRDRAESYDSLIAVLRKLGRGELP